MTDGARHEAPVFRVARVDGLHRFLEGRALDRALDPAAVVGLGCDQQRCECFHRLMMAVGLPLSMRAASINASGDYADAVAKRRRSVRLAKDVMSGSPLQCFLSGACYGWSFVSY